MKPNILLVTIDSLREDHVGWSSCVRDTTPNLSSLAAQGTIFDCAYAAGPSTPFSFPAILAGSTPLMYGGAALLSDDRTRLAEVLQDAGYFTVGIHANSFLSRKRGYGKGFDLFRDYEDANKRLLRWGVSLRARLRRIPILDFAFRTLAYHMEARKEETLYWSAQTQNELLVQDLAEREDQRPFFAWIHYMDVHVPYLPPRDALRGVGVPATSRLKAAFLNAKAIAAAGRMSDREIRQLINLYDAAIWDMDRRIGELLERLGTQGDLENTCIVLTADHGDEFGEHGVFSHDTEPFSRRGCRLRDGLLHVPLLVISPQEGQASRFSQQVSLVDLPSTVVDLAGISSLPSDWQGRSLVPALRNGDLEDVVCFSEYSTAAGKRLVSAQLEGRWKFVQDEESGAERFYDLERDPSESATVPVGQHGEVRQRLHDAIDGHLSDMAGTGTPGAPSSEEDKLIREKLRDLGYVD